jgi:hypothetical protein
MIFGLECNKDKKCNIHIFKTFNNILFYNQTSCAFCCNNFKDDIITLPCKHIFDLRCFITYTKLHYLENKKKFIQCPICKAENNILHIFKKYKLILEIRLFMTKRIKIVNNIYIYDDIYKKIDAKINDKINTINNKQLKNES